MNPGAPYAAQRPGRTPGVPPVHLAVTGVAGGVGTTTVAAAVARVLAAAMPGQVGLLDHDGGTLFVRAGVTERDRQWAPPDLAPVRVQCLGSANNVLQRIPLGVPGLVPLVVAPWHEDGLRLAAGVVQRATTVEPMVLLDDVTRARDRQEPGIRDRPGLPYDRALAAPGPLRDAGAGRAAQQAVQQAVSEVLRRATATGGVPQHAVAQDGRGAAW
ncbi:hypothetical protein [Myceligenerans crystallogenes]|uniref:CobQ/CobB/MinD/ParA nucleotide binding domain-containing protein n=1 Tax=Myceligenerans crystallogenes TaxID=316335 RepID=A0ABN2NA19_9MICO